MNNFSLMLQDGCLLSSGCIDSFNTMTINWGLVGSLWNRDIITCFVRPSSYTKTFLDSNDYFTLSFFYPSYREKLSYLGSVSGRDTNKIEKVGFSPIAVDNGVSFKEAYLTIICKKLYVNSFDKSNTPQEINNIYYANDNYHYQYIGEITKIIANDDV